MRTGEDGSLVIKETSSNRFNISIDVRKKFINANGTLATTVDSEVYKQPANKT